MTDDLSVIREALSGARIVAAERRKSFGARILALDESYFPTPSKEGDGAVDLKARIEPVGQLKKEKIFQDLWLELDDESINICINGEHTNNNLDEIQKKVGDKFVVLYPGERQLIPVGFKIATYCHLPDMVANFRVQPRSGLALKHGVTVLNSPGLVDPNYRGEVGVILINHGEDIEIFTDGARIAQGVLAIEADPSSGIYEAVESLSETNRGEGGYGSSGV